jgi:hypothetical protein
MDHPLPSIVRATFGIHVIVALVVGLGLLLVPAAYGALFGYPDPADLTPIVRSFGAMILGFGGLTSFYGLRSKSWERVDYVVRGEITYLVLQTLIFLLAALSGTGPALGNWLFTVVSVVLLALFVAAFAARPK